MYGSSSVSGVWISTRRPRQTAPQLPVGRHVTVGTNWGPHVMRDGERLAVRERLPRPLSGHICGVTCGNALPRFTGGQVVAAERVAAERGHTHDSATHHRGRPTSPDALLASPDTTTLANCKGATNKRSMEIPLVAAAMRAETRPLGDRNTYWPDPGSVPAIFADICRSGLKVPSKSMDRPRPESQT